MDGSARVFSYMIKCYNLFCLSKCTAAIFSAQGVNAKIALTPTVPNLACSQTYRARGAVPSCTALQSPPLSSSPQARTEPSCAALQMLGSELVFGFGWFGRVSGIVTLGPWLCLALQAEQTS